jgi:hypothetical protein
MSDYEKLKMLFVEIGVHFLDQISTRHRNAKKPVSVIRIKNARFYFHGDGKFAYLDDETDANEA